MASRPPPIPPRPGMIGNKGTPPRPLPPTPKAPSLVPVIAANTIGSMVDISGNGMNPIWIVELKSGAKLVVKQEKNFYVGDKQSPAFGKRNLSAINTVMQSASPTAMAEALTVPEISALAAFAHAPSNFKTNAVHYRDQKFLLMKMKYDPSFAASSNMDVTGTNPHTIMTDKDKNTARSLFEALRDNEPAWRTFGQVVIVDHLIGNNDRVDLYQGRVSNFGNLIFSRDPSGKVTHALGLDTIDPAGGETRHMYGVDIGQWVDGFGKVIADKSLFPSMAQKVIAYINKERLVPLGMSPYSGTEARSFANGLMIGWDKQANAIGARARAGKAVPSGLMARAKYLRWVK